MLAMSNQLYTNKRVDNFSFSETNDFITNSKFVNCLFDDVNLEKVTFNGCEFEGCSFDNTVLSDVFFNDSTIKDCSFRKTYFLDVLFDSTNVELCLFSKISTFDASFTEGTIRECKFEDTMPISNSVKYDKTFIRQCKFDSCAMTDNEFIETILTGCIYNGCYFNPNKIVNTAFYGCCFTKCKIATAIMERTLFDDNAFNECVFDYSLGVKNNVVFVDSFLHKSTIPSIVAKKIIVAPIKKKTPNTTRLSNKQPRSLASDFKIVNSEAIPLPAASTSLDFNCAYMLKPDKHEFKAYRFFTDGV